MTGAGEPESGPARGGAGEPDEAPRRGLAAAVAAIWGGVAALVLYAGLRAWQVAFQREIDPALVVWTAHSGYLWRTLIAGYAGGMAAIAAYLAARRDVERALRPLPAAVVVAASAIAAQAALAP